MESLTFTLLLPGDTGTDWRLIRGGGQASATLSDRLGPDHAGIVKLKMLPYGIFLAAQIRPRWASMIDRHIESPMPMPLCFVVNIGSKRRSAIAGLKPMPVSATATSIACSVGLEDILRARVRSVTSLIASIPFRIRFSSTCCN